jgi:hypothetical protein
VASPAYDPANFRGRHLTWDTNNGTAADFFDAVLHRG